MTNSITDPVQYRQQRQGTLVTQGWSIEAVKDLGGQPKLDYWRHKPAVTIGGKITKTREGEPTGDVGKLIPNQPGDADTASRLSARGLLPWLPGETCQCRACRERYGTERTEDRGPSPAQVAATATPRPMQLGEAQEEPAPVVSEAPIAPEEPVAPVVSFSKADGCADCKFVPKRTSKNPAFSLRLHRRHKHAA